MAEKPEVPSPGSSEAAVKDSANSTTVESKCVFCRIIRKELPSNIIYEDGEYIAFEDRAPVSDYDSMHDLRWQFIIVGLCKTLRKSLLLIQIRCPLDPDAICAIRQCIVHVHIMQKIKNNKELHVSL